MNNYIRINRTPTITRTIILYSRCVYVCGRPRSISKEHQTGAHFASLKSYRKQDKRSRVFLHGLVLRLVHDPLFHFIATLLSSPNTQTTKGKEKENYRCLILEIPTSIIPRTYAIGYTQRTCILHYFIIRAVLLLIIIYILARRFIRV